jgi:cyanate permease
MKNKGHGWYRWLILLLLWSLYACFGMVSRAIFPLVTPIISDLRISYGQMGLILGSWQFTYIIGALMVGSVMDRWGMHRTVFTGTMIIALSSILRFFPHGFLPMLLAVAVFGAGGPVLSVGGPKMISERFEGNSRGTAVGIYLTGPWIGGFIALSLTNSVVMPLTGQSWRLSFIVFGLATMLPALAWLFCARDTNHADSYRGMGLIQVFAELIRIRNVQVLLIMGLMAFAVGHGFTAWLPKILENKGMSPAHAGFASSVVLAAAIPSILVLPRLIPSRLRGRYIALFAIATLISALTTYNASGPVRIAGLILFGVADSVFVPVMLLVLMDSEGVDRRHMGVAGGMFFCISEIGGVSGPLLIGSLMDWTGTFMAGILLIFLMCMVILAASFLLKLNKKETVS